MSFTRWCVVIAAVWVAVDLLVVGWFVVAWFLSAAGRRA